MTSLAPRLRAGLALAVLAVATACGVLDVNNPNNVNEDSLGDPSAATPLSLGVIGVSIRALNNVLDVYGTAADEMDFVGSQDGFFQIDVGNYWNPVVQFSDNAYQRVAEARWTADQAITRMAAWDRAAQLANRADLANAYLYGAIVYATIGDAFDDFVLSDRLEAGAPIGEANMRQVYDTAVVYLDRGLAIATAVNSAPLRQQLLAVRARVKHSRALWAKTNPTGRYAGTPAPVADPLVNDAGAVADAQAALALIGSGDWTFTVTPSSATGGAAGNNLGNDLNIRREMRIGQAYARPDPAAQGQNRTLVQDGQPVIALNDPVTGQPDLALRARVASLIGGGQFLPMTVASARELHLILAEAAIAAGNATEARTRINLVRGFVAGRAPWDGTTPDARTLLAHERRVNLFLMGRRLQDMYRFGERDPRWQTGSAAFNIRGCLFPITYTERQANPNTIPRPSCEG